MTSSNPKRLVIIDGDCNAGTILKITGKKVTTLKLNNDCFEDYSFVNNPLSHATVCGAILSEISKDAEIICLSIADASGNLSASSLGKALKWCLDASVSGISMSLGTNVIIEIPWFYREIKKLSEQKVILVAAKANSGLVSYPAALDEVISVEYAFEIKGIYKNPDSIDNCSFIAGFTEPGSVTLARRIYGFANRITNSLAAPWLLGKFTNGEINPDSLQTYNSYGDTQEKPINFSIIKPIVGIYGSDEKLISFLKLLHDEKYSAAVFSTTLPKQIHKGILHIDKNVQASKLLWIMSTWQSDLFLLHGYDKDKASSISENLFDINDFEDQHTLIRKLEEIYS